MYMQLLRDDMMILGFPGSLVIKNLPANVGDQSLVGKIRRRRKWQPIPVFLPGISHGQRSKVGYRLWGHNSQT